MLWASAWAGFSSTARRKAAAASSVLLLPREQDPVVVVELGEVRVEGDRGPIVLLRLVRLVERAVDPDQVDVRLHERRVGGERRLVLLGRGLQLAVLGEVDALLERAR